MTEPRRAVLTVPRSPDCKATGALGDGVPMYCDLLPDHNGDHFDRWDGWWRYDEEETHA